MKKQRTRQRRRNRKLPSGVYRVDAPGKSMDGWSVNLSRHRQSFMKYFSNLAHGGERKALAAALRYRREILRTHPALSRAEYAAIVRRNNTSGVPGVSRFPARGRGAHWVARWVPEPGAGAKSMKFSVARYGEARARALAVQARGRALEEMSGAWKQSANVRSYKPGARPRPAPDARIARAAVSAKRLTVTLRDARLASVPLWLVPRLERAAPAARAALRIAQDGRSIEWPGLGLKLLLKELLGETI